MNFIKLVVMNQISNNNNLSSNCDIRINGDSSELNNKFSLLQIVGFSPIFRMDSNIWLLAHYSHFAALFLIFCFLFFAKKQKKITSKKSHYWSSAQTIFHSKQIECSAKVYGNLAKFVFIFILLLLWFFLCLSLSFFGWMVG